MPVKVDRRLGLPVESDKAPSRDAGEAVEALREVDSNGSRTIIFVGAKRLGKDMSIDPDVRVLLAERDACYLVKRRQRLGREKSRPSSLRDQPFACSVPEQINSTYVLLDPRVLCQSREEEDMIAVLPGRANRCQI